MARAPEPGLTKTRLIPALGAEGAALLSSAMTADAIGIAQRTGLPWRVCIHGRLDHPAFAGLPAVAQTGVDLGARLSAALTGGGVAIGTDCVLLTAQALRSAHAAVTSGAFDLLLGLAPDGGYTYVGASARAVDAGVFEGIRWSSGETARDQLARAEALALTSSTVDGTFDVDTSADLTRLRAALAASPPEVGAHTRAALHTLAKLRL